MSSGSLQISLEQEKLFLYTGFVELRICNGYRKDGVNTNKALRRASGVVIIERVRPHDLIMQLMYSATFVMIILLF